MLGVRYNFSDPNIVDPHRRLGWRARAVCPGLGGVLGLKQDDRFPLVAGVVEPIPRDEPGCLLRAWHDLLTQAGRGSLSVHDRDVDEYRVHAFSFVACGRVADLIRTVEVIQWPLQPYGFEGFA